MLVLFIIFKINLLMIIKSCKFSSNSSHNKSDMPLFPSRWCTKVKVMIGRSQSLSGPTLVYIQFKSREMSVKWLLGDSSD